MIKKWNQFVNESVMPGPGEHGSIKVNISDDEIEMFSNEPALQKLISDQKVALLGNEVWCFDHDENTIKVLKQYIDGYESMTNEEISLKNLGLSALMALAVSCTSPSIENSNGQELSETEVNNYVGNAVVKNIHLSGGKHQYFTVVSIDSAGNKICLHTRDLTFNVGDTIHIDMPKEIAYPKNSSEAEDRYYTESHSENIEQHNEAFEKGQHFAMSIMEEINNLQGDKDSILSGIVNGFNDTMQDLNIDLEMSHLMEGWREPKESYRDKMKRKVAKAKEDIEKGKRRYKP